MAVGGASRYVTQVNAVASYCLAFALSWWFPRTAHRLEEMRLAAEDLGTTDATPHEALRLMNIAHEETGFERSRVGDLGERGRFQIRPWPWTTEEELREWTERGAAEALRRLRVQGIYGYMGCPRVTPECERLADAHVWPAELYAWAFDPPR